MVFLSGSKREGKYWISHKYFVNKFEEINVFDLMFSKSKTFYTIFLKKQRL